MSWQQVTTEVAEHLADALVTVQPYEKVLEDVGAAAEAGTRTWMDPSQVRHIDLVQFAANKRHLACSGLCARCSAKEMPSSMCTMLKQDS